LLLHVADASNPAALDQIAVVYEVLESLTVERKDTLLVLNKVDAADRAQLSAILTRYPHALPISAHTGQGLPQLSAAVSQALSHSFLDVDVETRIDNGRLLAMLSSHGEVLSKRYHDDRVTVHCRIPQRAMSHFRGPETTIRPHRAAGSNGHASENGAMSEEGSNGVVQDAPSPRVHPK
jgi:GTP-binding protein HflX